MTRKLVTIRKIKDIKEIPTADKICSYLVDGWWVVDSINKYKIDEEVIYVEIDSWVPHSIAPFLSKGREPREYNGILGERLKTQKFLGTISQGLLLPISVLHGNIDKHIDGDYSFFLNVQKWEAPIPAQLGGKVKGNFPGFIPKTDQERCQNLYTEIFEEHYGEKYEITEKLEGTSMTVYVKDGEVGVCSRNWNLTEDDTNTLWSVAKSSGLVEFLPTYGRNIAIQGELVGEGIQKNYYGIKGHRFYIFDIYDIDQGRYFSPIERMNFFNEDNKLMLSHVPLIITNQDAVICPGEDAMEKLLSYAEAKSLINPQKEREGIVFKSKSSDFHFKAVSNKFLLKTGG